MQKLSLTNHKQNAHTTRTAAIGSSFSQLLQTLPDNPELHCQYALAAIENHHFSVAIPHLVFAAAHHRATYRIYNYLGLSYKQLNNFTAAQNAFEMAIHKKKDYAPAWNNLGLLYETQKQEKKALYFYKQACLYAPKHCIFYTNLIQCALKTKAYTIASDYLNIAAASFGETPALSLLAAYLAFAQQRYQEAQSLLENLLAKDSPLSALAWHNLLVSCLQNQEETKWSVYLQQALAVYPHHPALNALAAPYFFSIHKYSQALHCYQLLLQAPHQNTAFIHVQIGIIFMREKKWEQARAHFMTSLEQAPQLAHAHTNLGSVLIKLGEKNAGLKHFAYAMFLNRDDEIAAYRFAALQKTHCFERAPNSYVKELFDEYAENFDLALMEKLNYRLPNQLYETLYPHLHDKKNLHILDLGCGTGLSARLLCQHATKIIGVDLSQKMLESAKKKSYYDTLHCDDIESFLEKTTTQFDLIIAADVFVYFGALEKILKKISQHLKPNGLCALTVERQKAEETNYTLQATGRYTHHPSYVSKCITNNTLKIESAIPIPLRQQQGQVVEGYLFIFKKIKKN